MPKKNKKGKSGTKLQSDLLKDQGYYVPLKQLKPLAKQISLGDVSSLNEVEGRRMLKDVRSEMNKRSRAETNISKLEASDKKERQFHQKKTAHQKH